MVSLRYATRPRNDTRLAPVSQPDFESVGISVDPASLVHPSMHHPFVTDLLTIPPNSRPLIHYLVNLVTEVFDVSRRYDGPAGQYPSRSLETFVSSVLKHGYISTPMILATIVYITRSRKKTGMKTTDLVPKTAFIAALVCGDKYLNDACHRTPAWSRICRDFSKGEIARMQVQFWDILDFDLHISENDILAHYDCLKESCLSTIPSPPDVRSLPTRPSTSYYRPDSLCTPSLDSSSSSTSSSSSEEYAPIAYSKTKRHRPSTPFYPGHVSPPSLDSSYLSTSSSSSEHATIVHPKLEQQPTPDLPQFLPFIPPSRSHNVSKARMMQLEEELMSAPLTRARQRLRDRGSYDMTPTDVKREEEFSRVSLPIGVLRSTGQQIPNRLDGLRKTMEHEGRVSVRSTRGSSASVPRRAIRPKPYTMPMRRSQRLIERAERSRMTAER